MEYRKLGKWGVRVSEIGLGSWLTYGGSVEEASSVEQIHHAYSLGINFFDTANVYAQGQAELVVGRAIAEFDRESIVLATKVYFPMGDGPNDKGLSRKHVVEQCHASLRRLNTDYIDIYQCHRFDAEVPMEELVTTMDILTRQGKILYWGVSEWPADQMQRASEVAAKLNAPPPVSNQPFYNMLGRDIEAEVLPVCKKLGMGQVVFSPLAQGVLTGKYKPGQQPPADTRAGDTRINMFMQYRGLMSDETLQKVQRLAELASDAGITMTEMALAWCLRVPEVSSVITGASRKEQIDDNVRASGKRLPADLLSRIEDILENATSKVG